MGIRVNQELSNEPEFSENSSKNLEEIIVS